MKRLCLLGLPSVVLAAFALCVFADEAKKKVDQPAMPDIFTRIKNAGLADKPFTLAVQVQIKADSVKKFEEGARSAAKAVLAEKGCLAYEFHHDAEHPGSYLLFEKWKNLD